MDMAKRPVVISLVHKVIERAWRVVLVAAHATKPRVQDADVENTGNRLWIGQREVVGNISLTKALPMQSNVQLIKLEGLGFASAEDAYGSTQCI